MGAPPSGAPMTTPESISAARSPRPRPQPRRRRSWTTCAAGRAIARGDQGSAAKWTHAAIALAIRSLGGVSSDRALDPAVTLTIVAAAAQRRPGPARRRWPRDLGPEDARALLGAWLDALRLDIDGRRARAPARLRRAQPRRTGPPSPRRSRAAPRGRRRARSASCWPAAPTSLATARRCSRPASRPSPTPPPPPSCPARSGGSTRTTASRRASLWWPTASTPCTA